MLDSRRGDSTPARSAPHPRADRARGIGRAHPKPSGAELIELLETLEVPERALPAPGARARDRPARDPRTALPRRARVRAQESEFPLAATPEPFLSDELRRELAACSGLRLRPREDALGARALPVLHERLAGHRAGGAQLPQLRRGGQPRAALAVPRRTSPSCSSTEWPDRRRRRMLADVVWPAADAPTERELARSRAAAAAPAAPAMSPSPIGSLAEAALAHVRHRRILSAGALETYADCPVRWLVERELQPVALEPDPDPLVRGGYMHSVLEQVLRRLDGPVTRESLPRALEILDEVLERAAARDRAGSGRARFAPAATRASGSRPAPLPRPTRRATASTGSPTASSSASASTTTGAGLAAGAAARGRRAPARDHRPRRRRFRRHPPGDRARLQERRRAPRAPGRAMGARPPAPGRAVHARRPRAARARARSPASTSRSAAAICARAACSWRRRRRRRLGRRQRRPRPGRARRGARGRARRARWRWPRGCATASSSRARRPARATGAGTRDLPCLRSSVEARTFTDEQLVGDRAPRRRPAARRERRQRQDVGAGRAVRPRGARGRRSTSARSSRSRSPRRPPPSCATGSAAGSASSAPTRPRAPPRARSSRRSTASARGCCAPTRWPPASTRRSSCSTSPTPSGWPTPRSRRRSRSWRATRPAAIDLIAAYGAGALRSAILQVHDELRSRGERRPRLPAAARPRRTSTRPRAELVRRGRARRRPSSARSTSPARRCSRRSSGSSAAPSVVAVGRIRGPGTSGAGAARRQRRRAVDRGLPALHRGARPLPRRRASTAGRSRVHELLDRAAARCSASATRGAKRELLGARLRGPRARVPRAAALGRRAARALPRALRARSWSTSSRTRTGCSSS